VTQAGLTRRSALVSEQEILAQSDFDLPGEAVILLELMPDKPCLLIPSTLAPGVEENFELRCATATTTEIIALRYRKPDAASL
jgi:hypothetical protein